MIFVTVGTWKFDALIEQVDQLVSNRRIEEPVIAQIGSGDYIPQHCEYFKFKPSIEHYFREARLVISHGGTTVYEVLNCGTRIIAVANPHVSEDHQAGNLEYLDRRKYLLWCRDLKDLESFIRSTIQLCPYEPATLQLVEDIRQFIEDEN